MVINSDAKWSNKTYTVLIIEQVCVNFFFLTKKGPSQIARMVELATQLVKFLNFKKKDFSFSFSEIYLGLTSGAISLVNPEQKRHYKCDALFYNNYENGFFP